MDEPPNNNSTKMVKNTVSEVMIVLAKVLLMALLITSEEVKVV